LDAKRLTLHSAIASSDNSTTPIVISYWPGSEPRATGANDLVMISASVRFTASNGNVTAFADASFVNTIVAADDTGVVDPASDVTAIFHLTGMVTLIAPGEREFELETGAWATEASTVVKWSAVCRFPSTKRWENTVPPTIGTPASVRARYEGHEGGKPIFTIEDLTYLPKLLRASPRKATSASSGTPTTPSRLFKGKKRSRSGDCSEGPSTPSPKRLRTDIDVPVTLEPSTPPTVPKLTEAPQAPDAPPSPAALPKRRTSQRRPVT